MPIKQWAVKYLDVLKMTKQDMPTEEVFVSSYVVIYPSATKEMAEDMYKLVKAMEGEMKCYTQ